MELAANGCASGSSGRVSVPQLMQQLQVTQNELENIKVNTSIWVIIFVLTHLGWDLLILMGFL